MKKLKSGFIQVTSGGYEHAINPIHIVRVKEFTSPHTKDNGAKMLHILLSTGGDGLCIYGSLEDFDSVITNPPEY